MFMEKLYLNLNSINFELENIYIKQIVYFPNNICIKKSVAFINLN